MLWKKKNNNVLMQTCVFVHAKETYCLDWCESHHTLCLRTLQMKWVRKMSWKIYCLYKNYITDATKRIYNTTRSSVRYSGGWSFWHVCGNIWTVTFFTSISRSIARTMANSTSSEQVAGPQIPNPSITTFCELKYNYEYNYELFATILDGLLTLQLGPALHVN